MPFSQPRRRCFRRAGSSDTGDQCGEQEKRESSHSYPANGCPDARTMLPPRFVRPAAAEVEHREQHAQRRSDG